MPPVLRPQTISTKRLILAPPDETVAGAVLAGDFLSLETADGWPHEDTLDAIQMTTAPGSRTLVWLVRKAIDGRFTVLGPCDFDNMLHRMSGSIAPGNSITCRNRIAPRVHR